MYQVANNTNSMDVLNLSMNILPYNVLKITFDELIYYDQKYNVYKHYLACTDLEELYTITKNIFI